MLRSKSERAERPPLRPLKQRSMSHRYHTRLGNEEDDSIVSLEDQGRLWLMRGRHKSSRNNDENGDVLESWWWKRWTNSVRRGIDQWSTNDDKFTEDAAAVARKSRWRWIAKLFAREDGIISSIVYSRKTISCQYDENSYAQNFDEGNLQEEEDVHPYRTFSARFAAPVLITQ